MRIELTRVARRKDAKGEVVVVRPGVRCIAGIKLLVGPLHAQHPDLYCQRLVASTIGFTRSSKACVLHLQSAC